jgi:hypothetical protein
MRKKCESGETRECDRCGEEIELRSNDDAKTAKTRDDDLRTWCDNY